MALTVFLTPNLSTVHISACNRKGFEEVVVDVSDVIVTRAPTGYYEVVGEYTNGRKVTFTHIKRVCCQVGRHRDGQPKFNWFCRAPFRVRAALWMFELEIKRGSE